MSSMTMSATFTFLGTTLAAGVNGNVLMVFLLGLVPLAAAYWLLMRASRRPAAVVVGSTATLTGSLRHELASNFDLLRRVGEATPLSTEVWQRLQGRLSLLPARVAAQVAQTYHAIEVSNRLLAAASAYDVRGQLSIRQRRMSLWPTLEAAVRSGLQALGCDVTPALQARIRLVSEAEATTDAAAETATPSPAPAASPAEVRPFALNDAPRLTLFYGPAATAAAASPQPALKPTPLTARPAAERRPARPARKARRAMARSARAESDGQMGLWESVA